MATVIAAFTGSERHKCALDDIEGEIDRESQCLQAPHPVLARMTGLWGTLTSVGSADSSAGTFGDGLANSSSTACTARRASARQPVLVEEFRPVASRSSRTVVASDDVVVINTAAARLL